MFKTISCVYKETETQFIVLAEAGHLHEFQPAFTSSKSTIEVPEQFEICSKITIKVSERCIY